MPGSIHVSVLDFNELPSSSPSSSILIKASMGKSDYQTCGKRDFSLPLKTLRDNVIITVLDSEGNELSRTGVHIKSIIEKGSLDESLSLEGGGIVRLKLQFVLNEDERNKIRRMRESAMKRKCDELQTGSPRYSKIGSARGTVMPSSRANHEVSGFYNYSDEKVHFFKDSSGVSCIDSREIVTQNEGFRVRDQAIQSQEGNEALTKAIIPNRIYESEDASSVFSIPREARVGDENLNKINEKIKSNEEKQNRLEEKNEIKLEKIKFPKRPISSDDASKDVAAFDVKKHVAVQTEKREPLQKSSSNEMRSVIKPPPIKTQPDKVVLEAPKDLGSHDNTKPTKLQWSKVKAPLQDEKKSKQVEPDGTKTEECIGHDLSQENSHLEDPSALQTQDIETEAITKNEDDSAKAFSVEELNQNHPRNLLVPEKGDCGTGDAGTLKSEHYHEDSIGKILENETCMTGSCADEFSSAETSGAWIFPDEGTRVCLTTEIKQVKDSAGNDSIEERLSPRFSLSETVEKDTRKSGIYHDVNKSGKMKSSDKSSPRNETSHGPFGQAIKIAVMVAFGSLVLLTRQRIPR